MRFVAIVFVLFFLAIPTATATATTEKSIQFNWHEEIDLFWAEQCDWSVDNLGSFKVPGELCGGECGRRAGCTHFTWTRHEGGTCWLKKGTASLDQAIRLAEVGAACGLMKNNTKKILKKPLSWREEPGYTWSENCDFVGDDLVSVRIPREQCGGECSNTTGCTHFSWTTFSGGTCWMKKGPISSDQATWKEEVMICGMVKNPPTRGKTTRFWNCCGGTCGKRWIRSCQKDGARSASANETNSCEGGVSHMCNDYQPWMINENLAYGFASARLLGKSDDDACCACYNLRFASRPVNRKVMVVQVVGSAIDMGKNHFSLLIPGGGVGPVHSCSKQWTIDDWGGKNLGVRNKTECLRLPAALQPGCKWRFDWFMNADNPTITFRRVKCPEELTKISECRPQGDE